MTDEPKPKKKRQTRLSRHSFAAVIGEMLAGPCTAKDLCHASGMTQRYILAMLRTMRSKQVAHISGWEKDAIGRIAVATWSLGPGKDAKRPNKARSEINRDFREKRLMEPLKGTPFYGLPVSNSRRAALPQS